MKNLKLYKVKLKPIFLTLIFFTLGCCNKDDDASKNPIDQLPTATMTGENTIGCLVNGVPFTDRGLMNNFYQFTGGEYILVINWEENPAEDDFKAGQIAIRNIEIAEGSTYILNISDYVEDEFTGGTGTFVSGELFGQFETNDNYIGQIHFSRFDTTNNIMSGTFEFQAQEIFNGEVVNITNGRFDLTFTN